MSIFAQITHMAAGKILLSKSTFIRGLQCLKSLYLYKNRYYLRDKLSAEQQAIFTRGLDVGMLARELFPGGIAVPMPSQSSADMTAELIKSGQEVIYEACFIFNEVIIAIDILVKGEKGWKAIEVKSSMPISQTHLNDACIQYFVISGSGLELEDFRLVHINPEYTRGNELELDKLFTSHSLLDYTREHTAWVASWIEEMKKAVTAGKSPDIEIGPHCFYPYLCDFHGHCWGKVPSPSVFDLDSFPEEQKFKFYYKGIIKLEDIPGEELLTEKQSIELQCLRDGSTYINNGYIRNFLSALNHPVSVVSFGRFSPAIPLFPGYKPYQSTLFGFWVDNFDDNKNYSEIHSFITDPGLDPGPLIAGKFKEAISDSYTIVIFADDRTLNLVIGMVSEKEFLNLSIPFAEKAWFQGSMAGYKDELDLVTRITGETPPERPAFSSMALAGAYYESLVYEDSVVRIENGKEILEQYLRTKCISAKILLDLLDKTEQ